MGITAGHIVRVEYRGRVVVLILSLRGGHTCPVYFDREPFTAWFSTTGLKDPRDLVGRDLELTARGKASATPD